MPATPTIINVEYLNSNSMRAYPLVDDATELDTTGTFRLPRDLLVDFILPVPVELNLDPSRFYISQVVSAGVAAIVTIGYQPTVGDAEVVSQVSVSASHVANSSYFFVGQGDFAGIVGQVTIGRVTETLKTGGSFGFDLAATRLLPTRIIPDIRGVRSLSVVNDGQQSEPVYGNVHLVAGRNFRVAVEVHSVTGNQQIRLDSLAASADLVDQCGCDNEHSLPPPIRTFSGVAPKADGSMEVVGNACMQIGALAGSPSMLSFKDVCSQPCCNTPELKVIEGDLNQLNLDVRSDRNLMSKIESYMLTLNDLNNTLLATGVLGAQDLIGTV
jgi:hypothetical protein